MRGVVGSAVDGRCRESDEQAALAFTSDLSGRHAARP